MAQRDIEADGLVAGAGASGMAAAQAFVSKITAEVAVVHRVA